MQTFVVVFTILATSQLTSGERNDRPCDENKWWDKNINQCSLCSTCDGAKSQLIQKCSRYNDTLCSYCPKGQVWSRIEFDCVRCGRCSPSHQEQRVCLAVDASKGCMEDVAMENQMDEPQDEPVSSSTITRQVVTHPEPEISASTEDSEKSFNVVYIVGGAVIAALVVILVVVLWKVRRKMKRPTTPPNERVDSPRDDEEAAVDIPTNDENELIGFPVQVEDENETGLLAHGDPSPLLDDPEKENVRVTTV